MGDMLGQANEQLAELTDQSGDRDRILAEGIAGQGVIVAHGAPERGASGRTSTSTWRSTSPAASPTGSTTSTWSPRARRSAPGVTPAGQGRPERPGQDRDRLGQRRRRRRRAARSARPATRLRPRAPWAPPPAAAVRRRLGRRARAAREAARLRRPHRRRVRAAEGEDPRLLTAGCARRPGSSSSGGRSAPPGSGRSPDLREAMAERGLDPESLERDARSTTEADAERESFVGSPTIRVDGEDVQPPAGGRADRPQLPRLPAPRRRVSPLPDPEDVRDGAGERRLS